MTDTEKTDMTKNSDKKTSFTLANNFIQSIITEDLKEQKNEGRVHTRFPPEPNGYLHIGHAKAICLNFGLAAQHNGLCNLRFDDTNPSKEETEYVESILEDVRWLGFDWEERLYYASDYFEKLYGYALRLIESGQAYVCDLSPQEIREYRGTLTEPGKNSPYRSRSVAENLDLFERMRKGEFPEGARVLRAKIDMSSGNLNMRDPVIYRIIKAEHHRTGDSWCLYPMYDFAHPLSDAIEGITHSLCSLEYEDHRPLYDWVLEAVQTEHRPRQIEFARLELTHTVMSKRKLRQLVEQGYVEGWDDPRMPTLSGLRRRGYTPASIRDFCDRIGVAKSNSTIDVAILEHCIREDLNKTAPRVMAVLRPLKIIIDNYPEGQVEELPLEYLPDDLACGSRNLPFSRELYIEAEDFSENPPKKYFRLAPGQEVRLKAAYIIKCEQIVKDEKTGEVVEVHCSYDPQTKSGQDTGGRKVKGTIHWVSAAHAQKAEVRLYDYLISDEIAEAALDFKDDAGADENAGAGTEHDDNTVEAADFKAGLNPNSLEKLTCFIEPGLALAEAGSRFQFLRNGYFCRDKAVSAEGLPVFNRIVSLRDTWAKLNQQVK